MNVTQLVDYLRSQHDASSDTYWSDTNDLYHYITKRSNEILSIIGAVESTSTSTTTVASTQAYDWPTDASAIKGVLYDGSLLQLVSFRDWELQKSAGSTPTGTPERYVLWNRQVLLIPTPDSAKTLTFYYEAYQTLITSSTATLVIPVELHHRLADGIMADMYAKDLRVDLASLYEQKWEQVHKREFYKWRRRSRNRPRFGLTTDPDTASSTDTGVV